MFSGNNLKHNFNLYVFKWEALRKQLYSVHPIPFYSFIRKEILLRKMTKLTKKYEIWLRNYIKEVESKETQKNKK